MKKNSNRSASRQVNSSPSGELRQQAESIYNQQNPQDILSLTQTGLQKLVHELQVHQIELQMQNEELQQTKADMEASRARHVDLFDFAPVGYLTLSEQGIILEANLTAATMLEMERSRLVQQPLTNFIVPADQDVFHLHRQALIANAAPQECELRILRKGTTPFWTNLETNLVQGAKSGVPEYHIVISDITKHIRVDKMLQESERHFRAIFEQNTAGMLIVDGKTGRYVRTNQRLCDFLDYSMEEMQNLSYQDITHPDDVQETMDKNSLILSGKIKEYSLEKRYIRKDGTIVWGNLTVSPLWNPGEEDTPHYFIGMIQDITERKQAEESLRRSEELYRLLAENMSDVVWIIDVQDGVIRYVSPSVEKQNGFTPEDVVGQNVFNMVVPEMQTTLMEGIQGHLKMFLAGKKETFVDLSENVCKDGSTLWTEVKNHFYVNPDSGRLEIHGVSRDISERRQAAKVLEESERRFRSLFEHAAVGMTIMEANSSHYVNVNQRFCDYLGYTMEEILRMSFKEFTHPDDIQENLDNNALLFSGKIKEYTLEKRYIRKDGTIFWGNLTIAHLKESEEDSIPRYFIGIVQDINERKQAAEALRQSEELYHLQADNMRDVVWILNPEDMRFRYVSPAVEDHLGFTVEEIMSRSAFETVAVDMQTMLMNRMQEHAEAFLEGKNETFLDVIEQIHKDGSSVWTEVSTHFYYNRDTGRLEVQGVSRDISERRQAEQVLRQSEESYRLLAENMDDVVWVFDLSEMCFRYVSPSVQKISGYTSEEAVEKNINDIIVEEMQPMMMEKMEEHYAAFLAGDNATFIDTVAHRRKDGVPVWTEVSTHFYINPKSGHLEIQGVNRDISERRLAEEELRQSEESFRLLAENMEDVVSVFDVSEMRFRYISPSVHKISGYTPEEAMTQTMNETLIGDMQPKVMKNMEEHYAAFLAGENDTFMDIVVHPSKDGVPIWEELFTRFYINPKSGHLEIQGVSHDISARRRAEESLRQFKTIFDTANFGVKITDLNGNLTYVNDYFAALHGYQANELLGTSLLRLHPAGQQKLVKRLLRQLEREGHFETQEVGHCSRDGSSFPMLMNGIAVKDENGTLQGYAATAIDISERKKAEEVLQESEKRFRSLFEQAAVGVGIADTRTGHFIRINQRHCDFLGYTMEEMLNKTYLDVTHPDDIQENQDKNAQLLGGEIKEFSIDKRYIRKDGSIVWGNLTVSPMWLSVENPINHYHVSVIQDITERKRIEETIMYLAQSIWLTKGDDFFESLARFLAENLGMDYVSIDQMEEDGHTAQTVAIYRDGKFVDNKTYDLKDTPCGAVKGETICCFPRNVRHLFPQAALLQELAAESYIGFILWSSTRKPIGMITLIGRCPLVDEHLEETVLKLVALRAAGELERNRIENQKKVMFESLRETSDYLENLIGYANAPIIVWDTAYKITRFNRAFERLTGCPAAEMLGKGLENLFPDEQRNEWLSYIQRTAGSERWDGVEIPIQHVNGDIRTVLWNSAYIYGMDGKTVNASIAQGQDITERKWTEQILKQSEEKFRSLYETMVQGVVYQNADGMVTDANPAAERILGISLAQMQGRISMDPRIRRIHEDGSDFPREVTPGIMAMKTGKSVKDVVMGVYRPLDGEYHWVNIHAVPQFMPGEDKAYQNFTTFEDITIRKKLEDRLRKREREVSTLIENAPDMIERFDTDLREIFANQEAGNQFGVPVKEMIGKTPLEAGIPSQQQAEVLVQELKKTLETGIAQKVWQVFPNPPDHRYFLTHIVPERDQSGRIESLLAISRDFTEHKRLEMALQSSLIEKETLLHENHHRVKNNLQVITSLLGLQMSQIHDPDDKVLFEESRNRIQMIAMVHETLVQSKNMAQISMGDYMGKLTSFVYQSFGAPAYINIELMCEKVQLNIEQAMPVGLITNELFTNAFKYAFPDKKPGTIKISLDYLDAEDHKPAEVLLMVADNGVGLPAGWDIKQSESLGLSLVQILTRQLHGTLLVESQGGGASFSLRFRVMNNPSDKNGDSTRQNG